MKDTNMTTPQHSMDALYHINDCLLTVAKRCAFKEDSDIFPFPERPGIKITVKDVKNWLRRTSIADVQRYRQGRHAPSVRVRRLPKH